MDIHRAKASEIHDLANFYRITDYGGTVAPADRVVYATEEERIIGAGRLSDEKGVLVLRGVRVLKGHRGRVRGRPLKGLSREKTPPYSKKSAFFDN